MKITIYTKSNCVQCDATKQLFKTLGLTYEEISLEENPALVESFRAQGFLAAPVVRADDEMWSGFNEARVRGLAPAEVTTDDDWDF